MTPKTKFLFSKTNFDRSTKIRQNSLELIRLIKKQETSHILLWRGKVLFNFSPNKLVLAKLKNSDSFWNEPSTPKITNGNFIGFQDQQAIFYHDILDWNGLNLKNSELNKFSDTSQYRHPALPNHFAFCEIRSVMAQISENDAKILGCIKGIYEWNKSNAYCSKCGAKTTNRLSGWEKVCQSCNAKHFPRTDPVVIMLVYRKDYALLGRSAMWPKGMFSCLAGFMEPGESIETAVRRETFEETGVIVKNIRYVTSQPWPFPASLMIGCFAEAKSHDIFLDKDELEDAQWFSKKEISMAIQSKGRWWPAREGSIARFLINLWTNSKL